MTAFSNHSEFDSWSARWCKRCARDEIGTAPAGTYCRILNQATLDNKVPPEWTPGRSDRYHCREFVTGTDVRYPEQWHSHLALSQNGLVVHRVGCVLAFGGRPWQWSTDQTMDVCRQVAKLAGWSPCQYCEPLK